MLKSPMTDDDVIVVGVIGQKGGGGKTTTSIGIAVAAAEQGLAAVIIDIDQQANAAKWKDRRPTENVAVVATSQSRIKQTVDTARKHGADYIVIDSPGHNDSAAIETVRAADIVLLPSNRRCSISTLCPPCATFPSRR